MTKPIKAVLKETLLDLGFYHRINNFRFRNDERNRSKAKLNSLSLDLVKSGGVPVNYESVV